MFKEKLILREYTANDSEAVRAMLNKVFPSSLESEENWRKITATDFTAAVAEIDGEIVGAIPLKRFDFMVAPGRTINAWIEFRVGVSSKCRGMGVGSKLQDCLKDFLKGRADVVMVRSARENSEPYQFYRKNGFCDISMPLCFTLEKSESATTSEDVIEISEEQFLARDAEWSAIFDRCYAGTGGYILRSATSRIDALMHFETFAKSKHFLLLKQSDKVIGYGVLFALPWGNVPLEYAFANDFQEGFNKILNAMLNKLGSLRIHVTNQSRAYDCLIDAGYSYKARSQSGGNPVTVFILDPEGTGKKVLDPVQGIEKFNIKVWTPACNDFIFRGEKAKKTIVLEMKEYTLARLLTRRIDLENAIREERITVSGGTSEEILLIAEALKPVPWCYLGIDGL